MLQIFRVFGGELFEAHDIDQEQLEDTVEVVKLEDIPEPRHLRNFLSAMQNGEMTVSRGVELLEMWLAGNYSDDQLPPVRQLPAVPGLSFEDASPWDVIEHQQARIKQLEDLYFGLVEALAERFPALDGDRANDPILKRVDRWVRPEPEVARLASLLADDEMEYCLNGGELEAALKDYRQHCFEAFCRNHPEWELRELAIERGLIEEAE